MYCMYIHAYICIYIIYIYIYVYILVPICEDGLLLLNEQLGPVSEDKGPCQFTHQAST